MTGAWRRDRRGVDRVDVHGSEETHRHLASLGVSTTHSARPPPPCTLESTPKTRHEGRSDRESPRVPRAISQLEVRCLPKRGSLLVHGISRVSCLPVVCPGAQPYHGIASGRLIKYAFSLARVALKIGLHRLALNRPCLHTALFYRLRAAS